MRSPPSERNVAIVKFRDAGHTQKETAAKFGVSAQTIGTVEKRTREYLEAVEGLKADPDNLVLLARAGQLDVRAAYALNHRGILRIQDLRGLSLVEMIKLPNMGRRGAEQVVKLAAKGGIAIS